MKTNLRNLAVMLAATGLVLTIGATRARAAENVVSFPEASANDELRTGGCSGCFQAQTQAAVAAFSNIERSFRLCLVSTAFAAAGDTCSNGVAGRLGAGYGSRLQGYVMLQGSLRNNTTDPNGLGVPGGLASNATYRVSGNGSSRGVTGADSSAGAATAVTRIGFVAPEGFDGVPGTADDAGCDGTNACAFGVPKAGGLATNGGPNIAAAGTTVAAPLVSCPGSISSSWDLGTTTLSPGAELCVVNVDYNNGGTLGRDADGSAAPGTIANVGAVASNETTNLALYTDLGFADLPPADFSIGSLNTRVFTSFGSPAANVFGAQIFKLVASDDVVDRTAATQKVSLNDAQIENIFAAGSVTSICTWDEVGGDAATTNNAITVCNRTAGSGSRETFRLTYLRNAGGDRAEATGPTTGPINQNCFTGTVKRLDENGAVTTDVTKSVNTSTTSDGVESCLLGNGAIGYLDADRTVPGTYAIPVEGVDPTTAGTDLKKLTACGIYRYWGPLAGGRQLSTLDAANTRGGATESGFETGHAKALQSKPIFSTFPAYLPLGGVAVSKSTTDGAYTLRFVPGALAGTADDCPARPPATGLVAGG